METIARGFEIEGLRARLRGEAFGPGDEGYDGARAAWNLDADQYPELVVMAEDAEDIQAAVRLARERGLGVGVMATGHGAALPEDWERLVALKDRYDPENLFRFGRNIPPPSSAAE